MSPVIAIVFKDIVIEMRSKESVSSMLMFGVLVLTIFSFAFEIQFRVRTKQYRTIAHCSRHLMGGIFVCRHSWPEPLSGNGNR